MTKSDQRQRARLRKILYATLMRRSMEQNCPFYSTVLFLIGKTQIVGNGPAMRFVDVVALAAVLELGCFHGPPLPVTPRWLFMVAEQRFPRRMTPIRRVDAALLASATFRLARDPITVRKN